MSYKIRNYKLAPWVTPIVSGPEANGLAVIDNNNMVVRFAHTIDVLDKLDVYEITTHQKYDLDRIKEVMDKIDFDSDDRTMRIMTGWMKDESTFHSEMEVTGVGEEDNIIDFPNSPENPPFQKPVDDEELDYETNEAVRLMTAIGNGLNEATEICGDEVKANIVGFDMISSRLLEQLGKVDYKRLCKEALKR